MTMKVLSASEDDLLPTSALQMTVVNADEEEEAGVLVDRFDRTTTRYKMEIGPDKTKVMTNNKWLPKRDQTKRSEPRRSGELQVPWGNHL